MAASKFKRKIPRESGDKSRTKIAYDLTDVPALLPEHSERMYLAGIHPLVAKYRKYRSVRNMVEAQRLGLRTAFVDRQLSTPGLLIPGHSLDGRKSLQYRPDRPREDKTGRLVKYESPQGSGTALDIHPFVQWALGLAQDSRVSEAAAKVGIRRSRTGPIVIVESRIKADAFISRGISAIGLQGVWSWWDGDGKKPRPDFQLIPWSGMRVTLVPDSNVTKLDVHEAFRFLMYALRSHGATVSCKQIPQKPNGDHQGPDDWFGSHKTAGDFWALSDYDLDRPHAQDPEFLKKKYSLRTATIAREEIRLEQAAAGVTLPGHVLNLAEALKQEPPEIRWAIQELHMTGGNTVLIGPRKSGKSSLAITCLRSG
jgi:uncharacterized protein DUF3854